MGFNEVYSISEKYKECTLCPLHKDRIVNKESVIIGEGVVDALGLIITDAPKYNDPAHPTIYTKGSEETEILKKIFIKVGLSTYEWYITSTLACKGIVNRDNVIACRDRLRDVIKAINPKVILLLGRASYFSLYGVGPSAETKKGVQPGKSEISVIYTHNLSGYIAARKINTEGYQEAAKEMMGHWQEAANIINKYKEDGLT